ncbi:MAG: chemotaxis protein CheW [Pseudomonadota bacterium]
MIMPATAMQVLTVGLEREVFALDAGRVSEILDAVPVTEVPNARPFVSGVINVRGKVVPLADLRLRFGMECAAASLDTRIVVIEVDLDGEPTTVGILADKVYEVTEIASASIEETPRVGMRWRPEFIKGIGKKDADFIIVLDIDRVFNSEGPAMEGPSEAEKN